MKTITPILNFKKRFDEPDENRQWQPDESCSKFWDDFLKENEVADEYEFFADEVVVKHWFYCSACCPFTTIHSDKEDFMNEIVTARAGDIFEVWTLSDTPKYFMFKCPDERGYAPMKGAY